MRQDNTKLFSKGTQFDYKTPSNTCPEKENEKDNRSTLQLELEQIQNK